MSALLRLTAAPLLACLVCVAQAAEPAVAPAPAPKPQPPTQDQVLEDILKDQAPPPTPPVATEAVKAEVPPSPPLNLAELLHAPEAGLGPLEKEGAEISQARAQLVRVGGERKLPVVTFHSETAKAPRRPMLVLPNRKLEELERLLAKAGPDAPITVSGVVEVYRGNNYLRLTRASLRRSDANVE